jgi:hypothetical protein
LLSCALEPLRSQALCIAPTLLEIRARHHQLSAAETDQLAPVPYNAIGAAVVAGRRRGISSRRRGRSRWLIGRDGHVTEYGMRRSDVRGFAPRNARSKS